MKKRPPYNENAAIRGAVRRTFSRSPVVREVLMKVRREVPKYNKDGSRAKKNSVQYQCNACKEWVSSTKVAVDHIDPVIHPQNGFKDWNQFVERLFCDASNLQPICHECHNSKTQAERFNRQLIRDWETVSLCQQELDCCPDYPVEYLKKHLKKFTPKTLAKYPQEFIEAVVELQRFYKPASKKKAA